MHNRFYSNIMRAADAGAGSAPATENTASEAATAFTYNEDREFFSASELEKAAARAQEIANNVPGIRVLNFTADWPEGAGAAILPLARNETVQDAKGNKENKRVLKAILVWPIYSLDAIQNATGGEDYLRSIVLSDQAAAILNPMRRQSWEGENGFDVSSCPVTLQDHIEGMRGDRGVIAPYMEAAKLLLPKLKESSAAFAAYNPHTLRQMLQSSAMAKQLAGALEAKGFFVKIIDKLEAITKQLGGNVEIYQRWRDTRDQEAATDLADFDLDDLKVDVASK